MICVYGPFVSILKTCRLPYVPNNDGKVLYQYKENNNYMALFIHQRKKY